MDTEAIRRNLRTKYGREIAELTSKRVDYIVINHNDILDKDLYECVLRKKWAAQLVVEDYFKEIGIVGRVRFKCSVNTKIADLSSRLIGQTRCFEGIVRRVSEIKPRLDEACFICANCTKSIVRKIEGEFSFPDFCENCGKKKFRIVPERSSYYDSQTLLVQEPYDGLGTEQPKSVEVSLTHELCGRAVPGQRVIVTGTLKTKPDPKNPLVFNSYIECDYIEQTEESKITLTETDEKQIIDLSKTEILPRIVSSIAPTVFGCEKEKMGIALLLFGGVTKTIGGSRIRGDIHMLMIGDPGVAKSVLLKYASTIPARAVLTQGSGATKAGLTATAVKEPDGWVLDAGALVLADTGVCAVDELDKMGEADRDGLHGAMEQQEIDIAKAGIIAKLLCRCSLLAAANPKLGRFDMFGSIPEQFNLPPTLVSRFDLIFAMSDVQSPEQDSNIAEHILSTHSGDKRESPIPLDLLRKYIIYAKGIHPQMTNEAKTILKNYYLGMRKQSEGGVPITARSLEALVRLSEASARIRLSSTIEKSDAELVVKLLDYCMRKIAMDAKGKFDIDKVVNRYPREIQDNFPRIKAAISQNGGVATTDAIINYMMETHGIQRDFTEKFLDLMQQEKLLYSPKRGSWKVL